jgi:hypothetical protein
MLLLLLLLLSLLLLLLLLLPGDDSPSMLQVTCQLACTLLTSCFSGDVNTLALRQGETQQQDILNDPAWQRT